MDDLHPGGERLGTSDLGGRLDHATGDVDLPPVVDAPDAVSLGATEDQRGAPVRAELVEKADPAVFGPERDVVLAEEAHRGRALPVHQVRRESERESSSSPA